jgi:hypothetical protein
MRTPAKSSPVPRDRPTNLLAQPRSGSREGRVELLLEIAEASRDARPPSREAALWFSSAVFAWREARKGSLEAHLRVAAPRGSHQTARAIARLLIEERHAARAWQHQLSISAQGSIQLSS